MPLANELKEHFFPENKKSVKTEGKRHIFSFENCDVGISTEDCIEFLKSLPSKTVDFVAVQSL